MTAAEESDLDLGDGSLEGSSEYAQISYLTAIDFHDTGAGGGAYNALDLELRVLLAWSPRRQRIYVGAQWIDDLYVNNYATDGWNGQLIYLQDSIDFMVDGDHSGGGYHLYPASGAVSEVEWLAVANRTAQHYMAIAEAGTRSHVGLWGMSERRAPWAQAPPYADGGGAAQGEDPNESVIEFYVTPFDDLVADEEPSSRVSQLAAGEVVGFALDVPDFDVQPGAYEKRLIYPGPTYP